jgi:hypothetical protein
MWPPVKPYGEALPYVTFRNTSKGIQLGVFDYSNIKPRAVFIYVNGRLAGSTSGEGWSNVYVKCGDYVEALFQYDGFDRRVAGKISCSKPLKGLSSYVSAYPDPIAVKLIEAYNAANGYLDITGLPVKLTMSCVDTGPDYYQVGFNIYVHSRSRDVLVCPYGGDAMCRYSILLVSDDGANHPKGAGGTTEEVRKRAVFKVVRPASAPLTNYLGGGNVTVDVVAYFLFDRWDVYVAVVKPDGSVQSKYLGYCKKTVERNIIEEVSSWLEYKEAPASGIYHYCSQTVFKRDDGIRRSAVVKTTLVLYQYPNGSFGYKLVQNEVKDPKVCPGTPLTVDANADSYTAPVSSIDDAIKKGVIAGTDLDLLRQFARWLQDEAAKYARDRAEARFLGNLTLLSILGFNPFVPVIAAQVYEGVIKYRVPYTIINHTSVNFHFTYSSWIDYKTQSVYLGVGIGSLSSFGAVLATSVLPPPLNLTRVDITPDQDPHFSVG